jgi:hypothetical protein
MQLIELLEKNNQVKKRSVCIGYIGDVKDDKVTIIQCNTLQLANIPYCNTHAYLHNFTPEFLENLKKWFEDINNYYNISFCNTCKVFTKFFRHIPKNSCVMYDPNHLIYKKCAWFDKYNRPCRNFAMQHSLYCQEDDYVSEYTQEQKNNSVMCGTCLRKIYIDDDYKTCHKCRIISTHTHTLLKDKKKLNKKCNKCKNDALKQTDYLYCGIHTKYYWQRNMLIKNPNKRVCYQFRRGGACRNLLDINSIFSNCLDCREHLLKLENKFLTYKKSALKNNRIFTLTKEFVDNLLLQNCHYCNVKHTYKIGIDRKDNTLGYTPENSLPACSTCNFMKQKLDYNLFIQYCKNINISTHTVEFNKLQSSEYIKHKISKSKDSCNQKNNLTSKKRFFYLTYDECNTILSNKCTYCKNLNSISIGLDRTVASGDYTVVNTVACCTVCNFMKYVFDVNVFLEKTKLISQHFKETKNIIIDVNAIIKETELKLDNDLEKKELSIFCNEDACTNYVCSNTDYTYCVEHYIRWYKQNLEGLITHKNCICSKRGCTEVLEIDYPFDMCLTCHTKAMYPLNIYKPYNDILTPEQVDDLVDQPCYSCGYLYIHRHTIDKTTLLPYCYACRKLKQTDTFDEFKQKCINIKENYKSNVLIKGVNIKMITEYYNKCNTGDPNFEFTLADFITLYSLKCYYCGNSNNKNNTVFKNNNETICTKYNMVSCCHTCVNLLMHTTTRNLSNQVKEINLDKQNVEIKQFRLLHIVTGVYNTHFKKRCYFNKLTKCQNSLDKTTKSNVCLECMTRNYDVYLEHKQPDVVNVDNDFYDIDEIMENQRLDEEGVRLALIEERKNKVYLIEEEEEETEDDIKEKNRKILNNGNIFTDYEREQIKNKNKDKEDKNKDKEYKNNYNYYNYYNNYDNNNYNNYDNNNYNNYDNNNYNNYDNNNYNNYDNNDYNNNNNYNNNYDNNNYNNNYNNNRNNNRNNNYNRNKYKNKYNNNNN